MKLRLLRRKIVLLGLLVAAIVVTVRYGEHIYWAATKPKGIAPLPTRRLSDSPPPTEYVDFAVGSLTMKIPPSLSRSVKVAGGRAVELENDGLKLGVFLPRPLSPASKAAWTKAIYELPEGYRYTRQRARAAACLLDSRDTHWDFSRNELRLIKWLTNRVDVLRPTMAESVDTVFRNNIEGLLIWMTNKEIAILEWETPDLAAFGTIVFTQDGQIDKEWVRHVCASLSFDGATYSLPMKDADILALVASNDRSQKRIGTGNQSGGESEGRRDGENEEHHGKQRSPGTP